VAESQGAVMTSPEGEGGIAGAQHGHLAGLEMDYKFAR
jgi:hypothetical protein